tara:strand:+ start:173 stop:460 length:288 start_codon:yes stop_codon:yes gene_type:complete
MSSTDVVFYKGTFTKSNGSDRTMYFVRSKDLPNTFIESNTTNSGRKRNLSEGLETVWDLENQGWRTFNWTTAYEDVRVFTGSTEILNKFAASNVE